MFPALVKDKRLAPKDYVYAVRVLGADGKWTEKAWPLTAFDGFKVINDRIGEKPVVLIGDAASRSVRAYEAEGPVVLRGRRRAGFSSSRRQGLEGDRECAGRTRWPYAQTPAGPHCLLVRLAGI